MTVSISPAQFEQLKRAAKRLGRQQSIPHSEALDRIAARQGFKNWSLLAKHSGPRPSADLAQPPVPPSAPPTPPDEPTDPRRRYYLHGDQYEEDPVRYYCAQCDVFFDAAHFSSHGPHTGERYLASLERWNKRDERTKYNWRRPEDAHNILEASALKARAEYQALRPAFSDWLLVQRKAKRRDEIGFMAIGLLSSRGLPQTPKSLELLRNHYARRGARQYELDALLSAWDEFMLTRSQP